MRGLFGRIDRKDAQRIAVAAIGAIIVSSSMVASAVGPARAVETAGISTAGQNRA